MTRVTVLGAGLVGSLIARTLADDGRFDALVCDRPEDALGSFAGRPRVVTARLVVASSSEPSGWRAQALRIRNGILGPSRR